MNKIQQKASLSERAVQKVATENITFAKTRGAAKRKPNSRAKVVYVYDGVDPRIVKTVRGLGVKNVWRYADILSPTEVIIRNNQVR